MKKYLRITLHDNDFTSYYVELGKTIYDICYCADRYFENFDIPVIKEAIARLWHSYHEIIMQLQFGTKEEPVKHTSLDYFINNIEVALVDESDIAYMKEHDFCNCEYIYIEMSENVDYEKTGEVSVYLL